MSLHDPAEIKARVAADADRFRQRRRGARYPLPPVAQMVRENADWQPYRIGDDEPRDLENESLGEWQDRLGDEPGDPLLDWDDVPPGYDPKRWKAGL